MAWWKFIFQSTQFIMNFNRRFHLTKCTRPEHNTRRSGRVYPDILLRASEITNFEKLIEEEKNIMFKFLCFNFKPKPVTQIYNSWTFVPRLCKMQSCAFFAKSIGSWIACYYRSRKKKNYHAIKALTPPPLEFNGRSFTPRPS